MRKVVPVSDSDPIIRYPLFQIYILTYLHKLKNQSCEYAVSAKIASSERRSRENRGMWKCNDNELQQLHRFIFTWISEQTNMDNSDNATLKSTNVQTADFKRCTINQIISLIQIIPLDSQPRILNSVTIKNKNIESLHTTLLSYI